MPVESAYVTRLVYLNFRGYLLIIIVVRNKHVKLVGVRPVKSAIPALHLRFSALLKVAE
jgi:hypothetical protein